MEFLLILGLIGAVIWLYNQVEELKRRIAAVESARYYQEPDEPSYAPPSVALVRGEPAAEVALSEPVPEPATIEVPPAQTVQFVGETETEPAFETANQVAEEPAEEEAATARKPRFDIEDIFGRKLPIWVGGITLAIAGILLVRYSIEAGLVTPSVRVAMAFVFGLGLLAGAEFSYRKADLVNDPRICQALAGAGLATLYAGFYLAGTQYGLIGQTFAFLGLAAVTAGAIALSFRFGLPCAILGLVGGFAAPLLVGGDEANLPILTIYLGLVTAGLSQAGERQGRPWLSMAALAAGLGWGVLLLLSDDFGTAEILALGFYLLVLGAVLPSLLMGGSFIRPVRLASAFVASLQLALLVDRAGDGLLAWGLYLLMGAALAALAWKRAELREASAVAMVIAVGLLTQWDPQIGFAFYAIVAAIALIFMALPLMHLKQGSATLADHGQIAAGPIALAAGVYAVIGTPAGDIVEAAPALTCFALALIPANAAWMTRASEVRRNWFAAFVASAVILLFGAGLLVTPSWSAPVLAAIITAGIAAIVFNRSDDASAMLLGAAAGFAVCALLVSAGIEEELYRLGDDGPRSLYFHAILRWGSIAAMLGLWSWRAASGLPFQIAQCAAALAAYGLAAQILPGLVLPWAVAISAAGLTLARFNSFPARSVLVLVCALWAIGPLTEWMIAGIEAAGGLSPLVFRWPAWDDAVMRILPLAVSLLALKPGLTLPPSLPRNLPVYLAAGTVLVAVHILYKQLFGIETQTAFISSALAERTLWQALLLAVSVVLTRPLPRIGAQPALAMLMAGLSLAHFVWFTGIVQNPLLTQQAVGPVPIANLALGAGAVGLAGVWILRMNAGSRIRQALDAAAMVIIVVAAMALLRQLFAGSILVSEPMGQTEDLLRSLLGIVLAIAFLLFGRMRGEQSWRIGSLVVMVLAVAKVFLVDAAALEGLLRIASFMALGFSLLGIGWLYARQLGPRKQPSASTEG